MLSKKLNRLLTLLILVLSACSPAATQATAEVTPTEIPATAVPPIEIPSAETAPDPITLNVFAAASLTDSFTEIGSAFTAANPGITVVFNFAGSQQLAEQINQGAPADVFASANKKQMDAAVEGGRITADTAKLFTTNQLVVVYPAANPANISELADLAKPGLKLVLAAQEVPVGQYALDFLDKASTAEGLGIQYKDNVLANVVSYEENVKAVLTKVVLGEADAGIVYMTDAATEKENIKQIEIQSDWNVIAKYPIAILNDSANPDAAEAFIAFVLSPAGQEILNRFGFTSAPQ